MYAGKLVHTGNGEEGDLLGLERWVAQDGGPRRPWLETEILAALIQSDMQEHGRYLSVRYFVTDEPREAEELESALASLVTGEGDAKYYVAYSETTGYLWTTEELEVGGHDLLEELRASIGKYLRLEVTYHQEPPA